ncbi:uncharacterized protein At4g04980-like isoform X2 [Mercurialis annua]|uniref:uncharacterized protein At4g04980-like isoform X2 n=1 Tax=Mercurialis annua TaxID=3986 RepID=UPI002160788A|nr:uncharacterized protein At4g04980-like isoform X2 [Mercurialis annua]
MEELRMLYPEALSNMSVSKMKATTIDKKVALFFEALKCIRDSTSMSQKWMAIYGYDKIGKMDSTAKEQLVDAVFATLDCVIKAVVEMFNIPQGKALNKDLHQEKKVPGPPMPPPPGAKILTQRKSNGKLKKSVQMLNLFRKLKDKMEGANLPVQSSITRNVQLGGSSGGKEGLAASLAELTKRSPYFQQLEEDAQKYEKPILDLKIAIDSFQTNNMRKLLDFRNYFESVLEVLTDESQVLAKFEGFPTKKLETLRTAASLYSKLDSIATTLRTWEMITPLSKHIDKVDCYFSKVKLQLDTVERNKDEETKKFKSCGIDFDFLIITRVKEAMVDVSSGCIELALKERKQENRAKGAGEFYKVNQQIRGSAKMLWRVFQLAFRVYSFAGGHDDCADKLSKELADEILRNQ